jgi:hypothetical protein
MAYRLNLPLGSQIHPIFHLSQLKEKLGNKRVVMPKLPPIENHGQLKSEPLVVLIEEW